MTTRVKSERRFERGDRVYQKACDQYGTIKEAGPYQSGVLWDGEKTIRFEINKWMRKVDERKAKR